MFKITQVAAVAVIALALAGCSATVTDAAEKVASSSAPVESVSPTSSPVAIGDPTADADPTANFNGFGSQREWFLRTLDDALSGEPSADDDLIGAGMLACDQLRAGTPADEVRVVEGGTDQDNLNIRQAAVQVYCPELG